MGAYPARTARGDCDAPLTRSLTGAVIVRYALLAESVGKVTLARLVEALSAVADELHEELRGRFA
jgi:hypothetical protein